MVVFKVVFKNSSKTLSLTLALTVILGAALNLNRIAFAGDSRLQRLGSPHFILSEGILDSGKIQYFYELVEKNHEVYDLDQTANHSGKKSQALEKYRVLDRKKDQDTGEYMVAMAKVAYIVKRNVNSFTKEQSCDLRYLQHLSPDVRMKNSGAECGFQIEGTKTTPSLSFRIDWYENEKTPIPVELFNFDPALNAKLKKMPEKSALQRNFDFGKVFGTIDSAKSSYTLTNYYGLENDRTLVVSYSINFLVNLPPRLLGGHKAFLSALEDVLPETVERVENFR